MNSNIRETIKLAPYISVLTLIFIFRVIWEFPFHPDDLLYDRTSPEFESPHITPSVYVP